MKVMSRINQLIQEESDVMRLLGSLSEKLRSLFPWGDFRFYLAQDGTGSFLPAGNGRNEDFPSHIEANGIPPGFTSILLDSRGRRFGILLLRRKPSFPAPDEEDMVLARTIGRLTARGLHRIEIDRKLSNKLVQLEILNHLSYEISSSITANTKLQNIVRHVRRILRLSTVSLWLVDTTGQFLIKEATSADRASKVSEAEGEGDEKLARWQAANCRPFSIFDGTPDGLVLPAGPARGFISLPVSCKGQTRGVLNLFWRTERQSPFEFDKIGESMEFLTGITNQLAIFIENRYLQKHTTFLKEIHHRVKNNLQNVASILRLQIRRLEGISAEQALTDSISRIMSIAVVHETLCQGEIGMVDLRRLIDNVSELSLAGQVEPRVTVVISGLSVMVPSREATSLALVINELIQNAARHGYKGQDEGTLAITLGRAGHHVSVTIADEGAGLPTGFNPDTDGNLGLTIVRTLVNDELRGKVTMANNARGTIVRVAFPLRKNYYDIRP